MNRTTVMVDGVWVRTVGDRLQVVVDVGGQGRLVFDEALGLPPGDGRPVISHYVHAAGVLAAPVDPVTNQCGRRAASGGPPPAPREMLSESSLDVIGRGACTETETLVGDVRALRVAVENMLRLCVRAARAPSAADANASLAHAVRVAGGAGVSLSVLRDAQADGAAR